MKLIWKKKSTPHYLFPLSINLTFNHRWTPGPWSSCTVTCGKGEQTRTVTCQARVSPTLNMTMPNSNCESQERIPTRQTCSNNLCSSWRIGTWSNVGIYRLTNLWPENLNLFFFLSFLGHWGSLLWIKFAPIHPCSRFSLSSWWHQFPLYLILCLLSISVLLYLLACLCHLLYIHHFHLSFLCCSFCMTHPV